MSVHGRLLASSATVTNIQSSPCKALDCAINAQHNLYQQLQESSACRSCKAVRSWNQRKEVLSYSNSNMGNVNSFCSVTKMTTLGNVPIADRIDDNAK